MRRLSERPRRAAALAMLAAGLVLAGAALNSVLSGSEEGKRDAERALAELRARNERLTRTLKRIRRGSARDERRLRILRRQLQPIRAAR